MQFRYSEGDGLEINDPHWITEDFPEGTWTRLPLNPATGWIVVAAEPLTVTPSIANQPCGCHGFIVNGKWLPV